MGPVPPVVVAVQRDNSVVQGTSPTNGAIVYNVQPDVVQSITETRMRFELRPIGHVDSVGRDFVHGRGRSKRAGGTVGEPPPRPKEPFFRCCVTQSRTGRL